MTVVRILSGGAAQGLVRALEAQLQSRSLQVQGSFGAVGVMRDELLAGTPCDLLVLTQALIDQLQAQGHVRPGTARPVGTVRTGVAVLAGQALPDVGSPAQLAACLQSASAIYFPDPQKATAGIHFMKVLGQLGLQEALAPRLRPFPNGATAMREMAASGDAGAVGCTQVTEILYTPGVALAGGLPREFELATVYTAAVTTRASAPEGAQQLADLLASDEAAPQRRAGGFDPL